MNTSDKRPSLRRQPNGSPHCAVPHGYVLLFVLGLLAVVSTVVLAASAGLGIDTRLLAREKSLLQEHYALEGAASYTVAQLAIARAVDALKLDPRDEVLRDWALWRPEGGEQRVEVGGMAVSVQLQDVSGLPDANLLNEQEWQRLLLLAGVPKEAEAKALAAKLLSLREQLAASRGMAGFTSLQELLQWPDFPAAVAYGDNAKDLPGLASVMLVGNKSKRVNLNTTPLSVIQALGTSVSAEQIKRLTALRAAGPIAAQQAQQWLQGTGLAAFPPEAGVTAVLARLRISPRGPSMVSVIAGENGKFAVVDRWLDPGVPGR